MRGNDSFFQVERILIEHSALKQLDSLVSSGCERTWLLAALTLASWMDHSWKSLVGTNLSSFKATIGLLSVCADRIEAIDRSELIHHVTIETRNPKFVVLCEGPTLAMRLREYADHLEVLRSLYGPKRKIRLHAWKSHIVAVVIEDTKRPHDHEVSALIAAVLDDTRYTEKAHQAWRRKHDDFIELQRELVRERRNPSPPPPPS